MHFLKVVAFAAFALADLQAPRLAFTRTPTEVIAGKPVGIQYIAQNLAEPATIVLRKGDPTNLMDVSTLTNSALNGTYTWIPDKSLANASDYALQISQGYQINYSGLITLTGGNAAAVSSAKSASSASQASAASLTASAVSSIQSVIASYNSSLTNLTAIVSIQTSPPTPPTNTTAIVIVAPSAGTGSAAVRNTTIVSPTLTSSSSSGSRSTVTSVVTSSAGTSARGSSSSAAASASSTGAAAAMARASTPVFTLFGVAAVFFFQ
ncbi:hypothetical protein E4T50_03626 [Aureobasidium sp. EXF-12298]|nr:hypothetical protein E4T50_03626 [Aureobasidium sp. EXF-12298]